MMGDQRWARLEMSSTWRKDPLLDYRLASAMNLLFAFSTSMLMPMTDFLIFSIFLASSISLSSQTYLRSLVWSMSQIFEYISTNTAKRPKMQSKTKSLTWPSRVESTPPVQRKLTERQQAPISKKRAESASRMSLQRMTLHLLHLTMSIMTLKLPTKKTISRGKAIMDMTSYQFPEYMTRRKPMKPKELATWVRKILSRRTQRLKIFQGSLQRRQVVVMVTTMVVRRIPIERQPFVSSLLVNTIGMFWKEITKHRATFIRYRNMFCPCRDPISSSSLSLSFSDMSLLPFFSSCGRESSTCGGGSFTKSSGVSS